MSKASAIPTMPASLVNILLVGSLLGGWMGAVVGVRLVLWIGAAGTLLGAAYLAFSPVRQIKS